MEAQVYLTVVFSSSAFFSLLFLIFLLTIPHRSVVTNLFKPKIPDLGLADRQDLPIKEVTEKESRDCISNLRPFNLAFLNYVKCSGLTCFKTFKLMQPRKTLTMYHNTVKQQIIRSAIN